MCVCVCVCVPKSLKVTMRANFVSRVFHIPIVNVSFKCRNMFCKLKTVVSLLKFRWCLTKLRSKPIPIWPTPIFKLYLL